MKTIRAQLVLGEGLASWGIGYVDGSHLSHADIVMADGQLLGARSGALKMPSGRVVPAGVQIREPYYAEWKRRIVFYKVVDDKIYDDFYRLATSQIGTPYDKTAIWGFAADRNWRTPDSWFCSELVGWCAEQSGSIPILCVPKNKLMPGGLSIALSAGGYLFKGR